MHAIKKVLCHERLRRVSRPFSWVDPRLVRDDWLADCSVTAWALYLFWVTAADAQGLSYYSDKSVARHLRITPAAVQSGRAELIRSNLLVYEKPLVQVLSLDRRTPARPRDDVKSGCAIHIGDVLRFMAQGGGL